MEQLHLTPEEKADIFDIVNSTFLGLKGNQKKYTKRNFKSVWKEDNNCFLLIMGLYNAPDIIDNMKGKVFEEDHKPIDWETKKVRWDKHIGYIRHLAERNDELDRELEAIEEGKGYISEETHKSLMKQQLEEQQQIIRQKGDEIAKYKKRAEDLEYKCERQSITSNKQLEFWKNSCGQICEKCNKNPDE
tara:strand:+ start:3189 stop:3755 length:567 start_codon:yes stop_codon:yes gene_type:complete